MTNVSKELRAELAAHFTLARPEIVTEQVSADGTRKWLLRFPRAAPAAGRDRDRLHPRGGPRHALRLEPGRLHAHLQLLPYRHAEARAQPHRRGDRRPDPARPRPARRLARREPPTTGAAVPATGRLVSNVVHDGHGRAALQFRQRQGGAADRRRRRRHRLSKRRITLSTSGVVPMIRAPATRSASCSRSRSTPSRDDLRDKLVPHQQEISARRAARRLPRLSRPLQRAAHHLRICDAEGRQRLASPTRGAGPAPRRHPGQDQPHPVQSLAGAPTTSAPTGSRSSASPTSSTAPAMPRRSARRAAATSSPPAAS